MHACMPSCIGMYRMHAAIKEIGIAGLQALNRLDAQFHDQPINMVYVVLSYTS